MLLYNVILTARGMLSKMFSKKCCPKCFQKIFPQESEKYLFTPESSILTQRKIYTNNTHIKNSIVFKKEKHSVSKRKKEGVVFLRWGEGVETPMHTISWRSLLIDTNIQSK